jgi:amino acid efflux transporter
MLSTRSTTALYVGAVLGPGVLLLPALAARIAGPASVLAWAGLLALSIPLAITFAALGVRWPEAGGTAAYVQAAFGARAGRATGWWFLTGVSVGAPAVSLIGGFYVAELVGGGRTTATIAAIAMIGCVLLANARGVHTTARLQLGLAGLLAAMLLVAFLTALPHSHAENWTPFAPHGWSAVGTAASVLMFAFFGWEAVSHLAGELRDPQRQLPRAIASALAIVAVLYLGLATASIGVGASSDVPLADLMAAGLGESGRKITAVLAVLLTMGTMNTYIAAASQLARTLVPGSRPLPSIGLVAAVLLVPLAFDLISVDMLVKATSATFVAVYVAATAAGVKLLSGGARVAAAIGFVAVLVVFGFSGAYILVPLLIGLAVARKTLSRPRVRVG